MNNLNSGIYKITNIINNKCYVGSAKNFSKRWNRHLKDLENNCHHSIKLQRSFNKHGKNNFLFSIIEEVQYEKDIIIERENYWINELNSKENGYNIADASFGDILTNHPNREKIIKKISKSVQVRYNNMSEEERKFKHGNNGEKNGMYGKNYQCHGIIANAKKNKNKTFEEIYGIERTHAIKEKLSNSVKNINRENFKEKYKGNGNPFYGKTHSEETKNRIKETKIKNLRIFMANKKIIINNVIYNSCNEASKILNISSSTIYYRIHSMNTKFKDYMLLDKPKNTELLVDTRSANHKQINVYGKVYNSIADAVDNSKVKSIKFKLKSDSIVYKDIFYLDSPKNIKLLCLPKTSTKYAIKYKNNIFHKVKDLNLTNDEILIKIESGEINIAENEKFL